MDSIEHIRMPLTMRHHTRLCETLIQTLLLAITLALSPAKAADDYTSPESIDGSVRIDADELISLANKYHSLIIIDARMRSDRNQGFIPSSISLPDTETNCASLAGVIPSKHSEVVFYCNGPKCKRSDHAVAIAVACGYKEVFWFRGGIEEWLHKNFPTYKK
jgi:rhodanese-related sulfurtransferase